MRPAWRLGVPLVLALTGVLLAVTAETARGTNLRGDDRSDLPDLIRAQERRVAQATAQVERLRRDVDGLTAALAAGDTRVSEARAQVQRLAGPAGLAPVRGPGLVVALDDAPPQARAAAARDASPNDFVVHQQDVQAVVNALWAGGAEAMQLMDQRVISTSAVRCVGNTLILQGRIYPPPYTITAIGDPYRLRAALDASRPVQIYREYVDLVGLGYEVSTSRSVTLPAYSGALDLVHARAAT